MDIITYMHGGYVVPRGFAFWGASVLVVSLYSSKDHFEVDKKAICNLVFVSSSIGNFDFHNYYYIPLPLLPG